MKKVTQVRGVETDEYDRRFIRRKLEYLNNCMQWMEWFANGTADKEQLRQTISSLRGHCNEIEKNIQL